MVAATENDKAIVASVMVIAGVYVLINGNHYVLCPLLFLAAYFIMTDK